ncbi:hypothetical protein CDO44_01260 [Pigmentiphaga sp. NML080357]|uniref:alpha/beta hydrolase n=1 Tax=Pigmentiphaga sp. NML080357 TaxID=2008675 RepID=UPI000B413BFA|nr:alpha/beta hydrolase [Pigmentiphaga sp. NML080357]OVZ64863.1 hypothetical protein CDO44_01260 [Pigmentiphaga sp. NML080357]
MQDDRPFSSTGRPWREERFSLQVGGRAVPGIAWFPPRACAGLVLACHGGSGHKESPAVLAIRDRLLPEGHAVAAIDGPVHGDRRADGSRDPGAARADFRAAWRNGAARDDMTEDWRAFLDALLARPALSGCPVGYIGVSMGTAYGLPYLAQDGRVRAAVLGLWGTSYPASEHLAPAARRVRASVWFTQQWDDEIFDRAGVAELFDAIGSRDKRLVAYPGPHLELAGERLEDAAAFLVKRLHAASQPAAGRPSSMEPG